MRNFEHLLIDLDEDHQDLQQAERRHGPWFWFLYGVGMMAVGAVAMWLFFHFIVLGGSA
jgi:hypothetical protein